MIELDENGLPFTVLAAILEYVKPILANPGHRGHPTGSRGVDRRE